MIDELLQVYVDNDADDDDDEEMTPEPRLVKTIGKTKKNPKAPEPGLVKTIGKTKKNKKTKVLRAQMRDRA